MLIVEMFLGISFCLQHGIFGFAFGAARLVVSKIVSK